MYVNLAQLAEYSSLSQSTLRKWLKIGMPHFRLGRSIRVKLEDFDAWLEKFRTDGSTINNRRKHLIDSVVSEVRK